MAKSPNQSDERLDELFDDLIEMSVEDRTSRLADLRASDPDLHGRIADLLRLEEDAAKLIGESVSEHVITELAGLESYLADSLFEGEVIGPYRIMRRIGRGGMGSVYLAHRDDVDRNVALKVIRRGLDTTDVLRRFEEERRILASLNHPNIAQLLDAGSTEEGLPFFVMEYVEGTPIDEYCDEQRLNISQRLQLFGKVCDAVQHAHRSLIVHRDLKPGNILVDREGHVKLLDFGIAKALEGPGAETRPSTATGAEIGRTLTPEYASPEQFGGEPVTTASDVYALGVVLYELLTGVRPFRLERKLDAEAARVIREDEPTRPSTAIGDGTRSDTSKIVNNRRVTAERLRRRLEGDLDNIVLKSLRKEPENRYTTVDQFAADIDRHLSGLPVTARRPTAGYRIRKFTSRHRTGVAISAVMALLVAIFVMLLVRQNAELVAERDRAQTEARKATQVASFVQGLFEIADPDAAHGDTLRVRTALDAAARRIRDDLGEQPAVRANLMSVLGGVYAKLALYEEARAILEAAIDIQAALYGPRSAEVAETQARIGVIHTDLAEYSLADSVLESSLQIVRESGLAGSEVEADILRSRADAAQWDGQFDKSEHLYREAIRVRRSLPDGDPLILADYLSDFGDMLRKKSEFDEAEVVLNEALAIYRKDHRPEYAGSVVVEHNLAHLWQNMERLEAADSLYRVTVPKFKLLYGENHPRVGTVYNNIASLVSDLGRFSEADSMYRAAIEVYRVSLGDDHPWLAVVTNNIAFMYAAEGRYQEASEVFDEALQMRIDALGADHPDVGLAYFNLGRATHLLGDHLLATRQMKTGLAIFEARLEPDHIRTVRTRSGLGDCLTAQRRFPEAEAELLTAYKGSLARLGAEHSTTRQVIARLIALYTSWGKTEEVAKYQALAG